MNDPNINIEELLSRYFYGDLCAEERAVVEAWKDASPENKTLFDENAKAWEAMELLNEMEQFDSFNALKKVHAQLPQQKSMTWISVARKVAAILLLPLLIFTGWVMRDKLVTNATPVAAATWQTIQTPPGLKSQFKLPDGTVVWLNSSSSISFPSPFDGNIRHVKLNGEAFFDVYHEPSRLFTIELGEINVNVLGTRFNVTNYANEKFAEIVLVSGKVELVSSNSNHPAVLAQMSKGEQALYCKDEKSLVLGRVDTEKYSSWTKGKLIFRDDSMDEVVRRLNRWFNVNIEVADSSINEYVYTASFQDESLDQILELLAISAPIKYQVIPREKNGDHFSAKRIILKKNNKIK